MGEAHGRTFEPTFNRCVKVLHTDERLTSDAGAILLREADHRLGLIASLAGECVDPRQPTRIRYTITELLRERIFALAQGYEAQDDLDRLAHDPAMRIAAWDRPGDAVLDERLASQPTQSRLVDILADSQTNREALREALSDWVHRHLRATGDDHGVLWGTVDVDSFPIEVHGAQQGGAYNGYHGAVTYHPLVASFSVAGDYDSTREGHRLGNGFLHAILRPGNVHTAEGALRFMRNVVRKARRLGRRIDLRIDAGFTSGAVLDFLTDEKTLFLGRLRNNAVLDRLAAPHLRRPPGRPPKGGYEDIIELGPHRAESWRHAQRLILVVIDRPDPKTGQLQLEPDYFFLVTNWPRQERSGEELLEHYRRRGTFEDRLGEFTQAVQRHLPSPQFHENEVNLLLSLLAYNLASTLRIELENHVGGCWDLKRFQNYVLKAGGRIAKHSQRLLLYVAQAVAPLWERVMECINRWRLPSRWPAPRVPRARNWTPPPRHAHRREVLRS